MVIQMQQRSYISGKYNFLCRFFLRQS